MDSHPRKTRSRPVSRRSRPAIVEVKHINLALQGGGAHGAFTWGVLDRLLEEPRIEIEGVSATTSGAMNAVAMAHGLTIGGREGAREALGNFWQRVARLATIVRHTAYTWLGKNRPAAFVLVEDVEGVGRAQSGEPD